MAIANHTKSSPSDSDERWLPVVGYEGLYEVSDHGRIKSLHREGGRIIQSHQTANGHLGVHLCANGGKRTFLAHRIVAKAFVPGEAPGLEVCHNDGDGKNNHVSNLRWDTRSSNTLDRVRHGTHHQVLKTHCPHGHEYSAENTLIRANGARSCRTCNRTRDARSRRRRRDLLAEV